MAVLLFENLTADPSLNWMERGISEMLADQFSASPRLHVLPAVEHSNAARAGAHRVVSGYFSAVEKRLRLSAWVQRGASGKIQRMASAEGPLSEGILPLIDGVARQLDSAVQPLPTRNEQALRLYVTGREARDPESAAQNFARAVELDPGVGPAYVAWAQLAAARADRQNGQRILELARPVLPRLREIDRARLDLAEALLDNNTPGRTKALETLSRLTPADAGLLRTLGDLELNERRYPAAIDFYRRAASVEPENPAVLNMLGYAHALAGNLDGAVDALREYERLEPAEANPLDSLGDVHFRVGRFADAEQFYRQAYTKNPRGAGLASLAKAAQARLMTGDIPGADAIYGDYLKALESAKDPLVELRRAHWLYLSGRKQAAVQRLQKLARRATHPEIRARVNAHLAVWRLERGDRARARAYVEAGGPSNLTALLRFLTEPPAPASELAVRAERTFTEPSQERMKQFALGYALLLAGEFDRATPLWRQINRRSSPLAADGSDVLWAWSLVEMRRFEEAARVLNGYPAPQVVAPSPFASLAFPRLFDVRARWLEKQGRSREAQENRRLFRLLSGPEAEASFGPPGATQASPPASSRVPARTGGKWSPY